jgi:hypothetical protein
MAQAVDRAALVGLLGEALREPALGDVGVAAVPLDQPLLLVRLSGADEREQLGGVEGAGS